MASPPHSPPCLHGASRTTGGLLRGRALGNVFNFGDHMNVDHQISKVVGTVHIYTTHGDPELLKPYMMLKHEVTNGIAPILKKLGSSYSPVKSLFFKFLSPLSTLMLSLEQNQRVFVYEDNIWSVRGRYEAAIEENEAVDWVVANHQFNLKLLIVCFLH